LVERINGLKKTSQFLGKAKPNSQHLNLSESALAIPLLSLLFVGFAWVNPT